MGRRSVKSRSFGRFFGAPFPPLGKVVVYSLFSPIVGQLHGLIFLVGLFQGNPSLISSTEGHVWSPGKTEDVLDHARIDFLSVEPFVENLSSTLSHPIRFLGTIK